MIVDNFHSEFARGEIARLAPHDASIIYRANDGFAAGVNSANSVIPPEASILLLNPDAFFAAGSFETLVSKANKHKLDVVSPRILNSQSERVWFDGGHILRTGEVVHERFGEELVPAVDLTSTQFVSGCALLLSRKQRRSLLPMREDLFMYYEDAELSVKASTLGIEMWVDPESIVLHDEGETSRAGTETRSPLFYYYQGRNRLVASLGTERAIILLSTPIVALKNILRIVRREHPKTPHNRLSAGNDRGTSRTKRKTTVKTVYFLNNYPIKSAVDRVEDGSYPGQHLWGMWSCRLS